MIERQVSALGATTRVLEDGRGPAVVLLHGAALGCSADDWRGAVEPIAAAGFHVLAYDQPGFGTCDDPPDVSLAFRDRFLLALLDALSIERASLVGHSQAGRIVVTAALDAPARVAAGVIVCTGSLLPPLGSALGGETSAPEREPTPNETRDYLEGAVYDRTRITAELVATFQRFSNARNVRNAARRASAPPAPEPAQPQWQRLGEVTAPLLLIYGANDRGPVAERVALARERYPALPIHVLQECGHFAQWDHPEAVVELIVDFLRGRG